MRTALAALAARRPGAAAVVLGIIVYAALGLALRAEPSAARPPALRTLLAAAPHLIAAINAAALVLLLAGWRAIRRGRVSAHRRCMTAAAGLICAFLVLYVTRVALGGTKAFPGPTAVRLYVYLPMLAVHILLSIFAVIPVIYNLVVGLTRETAAVARTAHPAVGRLAVAVWSLSLVLGLGVYLLLNVVY
ncbi:MAG TPA: DUF420 domain-containing protein [bacterium]|nr:DUF420 domain-containing protein [bacterium]